VWKPTFGSAVLGQGDKAVRRIAPAVKDKVPVSTAFLRYFRNVLTFTEDHQVSGAIAFDGSPIKSSIGGKTGTAEVFDKQDTSWLASWGPKDAHGKPRLVVVGMIEQGGVGAFGAAPMVRQVYEGMLGVIGSVLPGGILPRTLPKQPR
jgi:penicillin-binding protein 2